MNLNRKMRRRAMHEMSLEERTKHQLEAQKLERRKQSAAKMGAVWKEVRAANVPKWAERLSGVLVPRWYIAAMGWIVKQISLPWLFEKMEPSSGRALLHLPFDLFGMAVSFITLKPFIVVRHWLFNWGLKTRFEKQNEMVTIMTIRKWGELIHESRWEA